MRGTGTFRARGVLIGVLATASTAPGPGCGSRGDPFAGGTALPDASDAGGDGAVPLDAADAGPDGDEPDDADLDADTADATPDAADLPDPPDLPDADATPDDVTPAETGDAPDEVDAGEDATIDGDATPDDAPDAAPTTWIRVGTGYDQTTIYAGYTPLAEGDPVRIAEGPQGGFHVWGGFEGSGLPATSVQSDWTLTTEDGGTIGGGYMVSDMLPYGDHVATAGLTVFLDPTLDVTALDGPRYELCATVYLPDGDVLTDCVAVTTSCCDYL